MRTNIVPFPIEIHYPIERIDQLENNLFFDIETTGFSPTTSFIYMIGCVSYVKETDEFQVIQWFAEDKQEETILLHTFFEYAKGYTTLIHYNGQGFDMPYITKKCLHYNLPYRFTDFASFDIYRQISPYKKLLKLTQLKQKSIEEFLDLSREDPFTGGELISVYEEYLKSREETLYLSLIQHNLDDLRYMLHILPILSYSDFFKGGFSVTDYSVSETLINSSQTSETDALKEIIFELVPHIPFPKRISFGNSEVYFTGFKDKCKLKIRIYTGELKFFYPNYKDYYYLPVEDTSIHKSVAFYVDKNYRTQAKAANCYSRKTGHFLPQYEEIVSPYFKREYKDKMTYFEVTDDFTSSKALQYQYVLHIMNQIAK